MADEGTVGGTRHGGCLANLQESLFLQLMEEELMDKEYYTEKQACDDDIFLPTFQIHHPSKIRQSHIITKSMRQNDTIQVTSSNQPFDIGVTYVKRERQTCKMNQK